MTVDESVRARGIVYLVGAGPGDPGLITVRGRALLADCDVVVYDALANTALLDGVDAERYDVGKRGGRAESARQEEISALLFRLAAAGKRVVRLKGGDPFVFGRGSEEASSLAAAGIRFEVVPGVTAGIAAPAYAGIPVTHRGLATSVTFVTAREAPEKEKTTVDWRALARVGGTIVLYMGVQSLAQVLAELRSGGLSAETPAAAVRWGTTARQVTIVSTLGALADDVVRARLASPVITIIGPVVALRDTIAWVEHRPLFGRRILVTRAQAWPGERSKLADGLTAVGAEVIEVPTTRIEPTDAAPLTEALSRIAAFQWIVLTSQTAVEYLWSALRAAGRDARALASARFAVVGPATAGALLARGVAADVVPERFVGEALLDALRARHDGNMAGSRVLYIAAEGARDVVPNGLRALGAEVHVVPCYRSVPDRAASDRLHASVENGEIDLVTFTSASAVRSFIDALGTDAARHLPIASIGPVTSEALRAVGVDPAVEADQSTMPGLVSAIIRWANERAGDSAGVI